MGISLVHDTYREMELNHDEFPEDDEMYIFTSRRWKFSKFSTALLPFILCKQWLGRQGAKSWGNKFKYLRLAQRGFWEIFLCAEKRRFIRDNRSNFTRLFAPIFDFPPNSLSIFIKELRFYDWAVKKSTIQQSTQRAENDTKKCYDLLRNFMIFKLTKFLTLARRRLGY